MVTNKKGKILNGQYVNWEIAIQDDTAETGGYYVLVWSEKDNLGYDDWFESFDEMATFVNKEYIVEWTDHDYVPKQPTQDEIKKVEEFQALAKKKGF